MERSRVWTLFWVALHAETDKLDEKGGELDGINLVEGLSGEWWLYEVFELLDEGETVEALEELRARE